MQASAIHAQDSVPTGDTLPREKSMRNDSTPPAVTAKRILSVCPGKPFASASFGDDPFPHCHSPAKTSRQSVLMMRRASIIFHYLVSISLAHKQKSVNTVYAENLTNIAGTFCQGDKFLFDE